MNEKDREALNLLGLARKGHMLIAGRTAVARNIKRGKLLILASDLSRKTREKWLRDARFYGIEVIEKWDMETIGRAIGKKPVGVLLITDKGMAERLKQLL